MSNPSSAPDPTPAAAPARPPYVIPPQDLRDMVLTLPRPGADEPATAWQEVVQGGLDRLGALDPRDALQTMLAVTVIATQAGAVDACRLAFDPDASAVQALRTTVVWGPGDGPLAAVLWFAEAGKDSCRR